MSALTTIRDKTEFGSQFNEEGSSSKLNESSSFLQWLEFVPRSINHSSLKDHFSNLETPSQDKTSQEGTFNQLVDMLKNRSDEDLGKVTLNVNASGSIKQIADAVVGSSETEEEKKMALDIESRHSSYAVILPFNSDTHSYDSIQLACRDWKNNCWIIEKDDGTTERIDLEKLSDQSQLIFMRKTVCSEISSFADPTEIVADRNPSGEYRVANASSSSSTSAPFFQEVQFDGFCGKHSINNMSGAHTIGASEMIEKKYFDQDSNAKISTCSFKAHPEIINSKFGTSSKKVDVTKENQGQVSQQLGEADRFTRADDNGHNGSGHVSAYRKDLVTGEWWHIDSLGEENGRISQSVVNVNALPPGSFLIVPMQEDEAIKDLLTTVDKFEDSHLNPVSIEVGVSIDFDDTDDEGETSNSSSSMGHALPIPSTVAIESSSNMGTLKTIGEKIRLLPPSQEKEQLKKLHDAFFETYREKSSSSKEGTDKAVNAFVSGCRGILNRRLNPSMLKV